MEADPAIPAKKRRSLKPAGLLVLFIIVAMAVALALKPPATEPRTLFLHPDGLLSLGSREAAKFTAAEIEHWPRSDELQPGYQHFVLDAPAGTLLSAWSPTIEPLAGLGYPYYQLRVEGDSLNFHLPGMGSGHLTAGSTPVVVDLRRSGTPFTPQGENSDVVILIDRFATCDQVLEAARPHLRQGTSLTIGDETGSLSSGTMFLFRTRSEDESFQPPKQSLAARLRGILPF
ncbi:hypothetical protein OKA05_15360 [Luteolibacter arcticus]|uniref:Phosphodiester glycosidase domain-containing protein n=1 Tax=Luteolibacter arcticus TaxID=1581411 RepID=A0ABT3GK93_9BACT|nr:hypothetical protein [Luteolibacter arcticus]MCW1923944.1 hypothetical protein [Luteolibacter arcticus]